MKYAMNLSNNNINVLGGGGVAMLLIYKAKAASLTAQAADC